MQTETIKKERVIVYIDGFNLYFGMREAGFDQCRWLNVRMLAENLLQANQELVGVKYFTSRVSNNSDKQKRQSTYIDALETVNVKIIGSTTSLMEKFKLAAKKEQCFQSNYLT